MRFKIFAYEGMVDRARAEIAWAQRGLALVDELHTTGRVIDRGTMITPAD